MGSVQRGIEVVEFACGIPQLLKGEYSENVGTQVDTHTLRQPVGVCAGITPFNFPVMVPLWMFPMAIACGNTFILKPSEKVPSASIRMAELFKEAGLPDGVFNVVHGDKAAVDAFLNHPGINAVSFVGSTPIAKYIYETARSNGKRVQALGGAKNHAVVLPDADLEFAADALIGAAYGSAGERCMAISAVVAVGAAGDPLVNCWRRKRRRSRSAGHQKASTWARSSPPAPRQGRVLHRAGREGRREARRRRAQAEDAEGGLFPRHLALRPRHAADGDLQERDLRAGAGRPEGGHAGGGNRAGQPNPYANGTAIFTESGGAARRFAAEIQVGMVGVNVPIPVPVAFYSFGGWKSSLFGDLHVHGTEGVKFYTRTKAVTTRWPHQDTPAPGFNMPTLG